ncbi:hypothetical protein FOMPIDRAFT_1050561 [Fomitopsis schrenkii]|uniref:Uncharacterized protein n=1 Tax=Fomitopsis schrenkii TaxID=2126942 RepID=S8E414_FOMSC|nr:hypothetical protein FOMPIDRAFT_1050561 [Fomitopsis schrenkii]
MYSNNVTTNTSKRAPLSDSFTKTKDFDYSPKELLHSAATSQSTSSPTKTQSAKDQKTAEEGVEEDMAENLRPASPISEALVCNFVREMHERSLVGTEEQELHISEGVTVQVDPIPAPTITAEELLGSILNYRRTNHTGKRRL